MNKITPNRIAIFSSDVMMKNKSMVVVSSTAAAPLHVQCSTHSHALERRAPARELRGALPEFRLLPRLLSRLVDASAAALQFLECARRDRRFYSDLTRR